MDIRTNPVQSAITAEEVLKEARSVAATVGIPTDVVIEELALEQTEREVASILEAEAESIPFDVEQETKEVVEQFPDLVNKDEVQSEDADIPEEVVPAEQPTDGAPEADENETMTPEEKEIADLRARLAELET